MTNRTYTVEKLAALTRTAIAKVLETGNSITINLTLSDEERKEVHQIVNQYDSVTSINNARWILLSLIDHGEEARNPNKHCFSINKPLTTPIIPPCCPNTLCTNSYKGRTASDKWRSTCTRCLSMEKDLVTNKKDSAMKKELRVTNDDKLRHAIGSLEEIARILGDHIALQEPILGDNHQLVRHAFLEATCTLNKIKERQ